MLHIHRTDESRREIWSLFHDRTAIYDEIVNRRLHSHNKSFMSITSWLVAKRFSVSRIPIYVGLSLSIIWAVMVFIAVDIDFTGINVQVRGFN